MIERKSMKVGKIEVIFHNKTFELSKDTKKLKKEINLLIENINKLTNIISKHEKTLNSWDKFSNIEKACLPKSKLENLINDYKSQRMDLIDDLRNLSCFCCPITMELKNLDLDSQIQDLYTHISQKQDDLLNILNLKHGCEAKQIHDPTYGDVWVGCRTFNNGTGVATDSYPFDKDLNLVTQSERTINRTEDDYDANKDILEYEPEDTYKSLEEGVLNPEEALKAMKDTI